MKSYIYLFCSAFLLLSCEEVIDLELPTTAARLTVEATIETTLKSNATISNFVKLSTSTGFYTEKNPVVTNASVSITDGVTTYPYTDPDKDGVYTPETSFSINPEATYTLEVLHASKKYSATANLIPVSAIEKIEEGDKTLFDGDEKEIIVTFTDNPDREDFYYFDLDKGKYDLSDDTFIEGNSFAFSNFYQEKELDDKNITIKIAGITKSYFNFMRILLEQSGDSGGPFTTAPATVRGNIINPEDATDFAFGFFRISQTDSKSITLK